LINKHQYQQNKKSNLRVAFYLPIIEMDLEILQGLSISGDSGVLE